MTRARRTPLDPDLYAAVVDEAQRRLWTTTADRQATRDTMLSKRIAGILKQYPNPEVAFFATEVLTGNATSVYHGVAGAHGKALK